MNSPLAHELRLGSADSVRRALASGADPNTSGSFHISSTDFEEKLEVLVTHGWDIDNCQLVHDAKHGLGKRVEAYLKRGANPKVVDERGQTALHKFAKLGIGRDAIIALLQAGADVDARDLDGNTPLDLAERSKRKTAQQVLLGWMGQL